MLTEKTFDAGGVSIHYAEGPNAGNPLLLLHGVTGRWQEFLPVLPEFSFRYHTYALDLRGHGKSGRTPGAYRAADYAGDVVAFLRSRVVEPANLLGHSLGAMIAIQVAADAPEQVRAVVLEDPPFSDLATPEPSSRSRFRAMRTVAEMEGSLDERMDALAAFMPNVERTRLLATARRLIQLDLDVLTHSVERKTFANFKADETLRRIQCPVLLVQGNPALGGALADGEAEWVMSHLAHGTRVQVQNAGHGIRRGQQVAFMHIVHDFLESL